MRDQGDLPVCIGFGISEPKHVEQLSPHCDGLIVGSAIVRRIQEGTSTDDIVKNVSQYVKTLLDALPN